MNSRARQLTRAEPHLSVCGDRLIVTHPEVAERLDAAIRGCRHWGDGASGAAAKTFIPLPRTRRLPLLFWVAPFEVQGPVYQVKGDTWVSLFCHDPEFRIPLSETYLRDTYGMTRAEARIGVLLATGHSTDEIGAATGTTINAVKFHLKSIYAKTGTHRQCELVARILPNAVLGCYGFC
jgi:DNA-binding CsgD family transcriptional regulator